MRSYGWAQNCRNGKVPLYMAVTKDKYRLPLAVADSMRELAQMCGVKESSVGHGIALAEKGKKTKFIRVWVEQEGLYEGI